MEGDLRLVGEFQQYAITLIPTRRGLTKAEGYRIPGHRLGMVIASPELLESIRTVCDCMQVCPPTSFI